MSLPKHPKYVKPSIVILILTILPLAGCAPWGHLEPAHIFHADQPITIEMKNYSFKPNHLMVRKNESPISLILRNTDDIAHNFTLWTPDRSVVISQDLKPRESATIDIGFLNPENYLFYCFYHHYRGMGGMLMVE